MIATFDKVQKLDSVYGIWNYSDRLRVTYVKQGWLIVWDHQQSPPTRYDCQHDDHEQACHAAVDKIKELSAR